MTVIIGIKHEGEVWLGADAFLGNGQYAYRVAQPKIFRCQVPNGGQMVIGVSGGHRANFLMRSIELPEHPKEMDTHTYVAEFLVNAIRERYSKAGYLENENSIEKNEAILLIGYYGRLFAVWYNFQVDEYAQNYAAIGAGMEIALGALWMVDVHSDYPPDEKIRLVLDACEEHSPWVSRPYTIMKVEEPKDVNA